MHIRFKSTIALTGLLLFLTFGLAFANETVTGVIEKSGFSGVIIDGIKYNTGRETKYEPEDYRPFAGDKVTLTYYQKAMRNGNNILAVSNLTLVKKDPKRKELESPAQGVIQEIGRKKIRFEFPKTNQVISMEMNRKTVRAPEGWHPSVGDKVIVTFKNVKARFGNRFVAIIEKMEKTN